MLRSRFALTAFLVFASVARQARPAVRAGRPRIWLTPEGLSRLRERCTKLPRMRSLYGSVKEAARSGRWEKSNAWNAQARLQSAALLYVVEGKGAACLPLVKKLFRRIAVDPGDIWRTASGLRAMAVAFDWCHEGLSPEERQEFAGNILEFAKIIYDYLRHTDYNNQLYAITGQIVFAAVALSGEEGFAREASDMLDDYEKLLKRHLISATNQAGSDGGWHESVSYLRFVAKGFSEQLECWRTATGEDLFGQSAFLRNAARALVHMRRPDSSLVQMADCLGKSGWTITYEGYYMPLIASRYKDPLAQYVVSKLPGAMIEHRLPMILWYDTGLKPSSPESLPASALFRGIGWVTMRSDWSRDAAYAAFRSAPYYGSHQHWDENGFTILRRRPIACDLGKGFKETKYHNTLFIGGPQRPHETDERMRFCETMPGSRFDRGRIVAFRDEGSFCFVRGEAANAYAKGTVERFTRDFVFVRPDVFVILDRVRASPEAEREWLMHTRLTAKLEGRQKAILGDDGEAQCLSLLPQNSRIEVDGQDKGLRCLRVRDRSGSRDTCFLHLVVVPRRSEGGEFDTDLSTVEGTCFLSFSRADVAFELRFDPTGTETHLQITAGKTAFDGPLEDEVVLAGE